VTQPSRKQDKILEMLLVSFHGIEKFVSCFFQKCNPQILRDFPLKSLCFPEKKLVIGKNHLLSVATFNDLLVVTIISTYLI